nr:hypothetical protein Q903MT_gene2019 [Picea sitchensis]
MISHNYPISVRECLYRTGFKRNKGPSQVLINPSSSYILWGITFRSNQVLILPMLSGSSVPSQ